MFCTNCGASNDNGGDLCVNCGESLRSNQIEDKLSRLKGLDGMPSSSKFGFLHPLVDFSFHRPVTVKMMKFLYILSIIGASLIGLFLLLLGFETSLWLGLFALLIGAVLFLLIVVFSRIFLEMILVVFRTADHKADRRAANAKEKPEPKEGIQWNV